MFSSLKDKFKTFILQPLVKRTSSYVDRRSSSIIVESKVKKIQSKRGQSETKANTKTKLNTCPQQVQFQITPIKNNGKDTKKLFFDEMETNKKFELPVHSESMVASNSNPRWLDYVSDIDSGLQSNRLLPTSQQLKTPKKSVQINNVDETKPSKVKVINSKCKQVEQNQSKPNTKQQDTIINWLQGNTPQYYIIKLCKDQDKDKLAKKSTTSQLKKKRLQQYQQQKQKNLKEKPKQQCILCEEPAKNKQEYHHLACTHRIHKVCADIIKWNPRMRCPACQRKSIKDLSLKNNFGMTRRTSTLSRGNSINK